MALNLNRTFRLGVGPEGLYEITRGIWRVGAARERVRFVFAVYRGVVQEVFQVRRWRPAGSTPYSTRRFPPEELAGRWEFEGVVAEPEIREKYVGKRLPRTRSQNPVRYFNCQPNERSNR